MEIASSGASAESIEAVLPALREELLGSITAAVTTMVADAAARARHLMQTERQACEAERQALRQQIADARIHLEAEQQTSRMLTTQLAVLRAAKESAEASHGEAQDKLQQLSAAFADRVHALEEELDQVRMERARLAKDLEIDCAERRRILAVLDSIRSAIGSGIAPPPQSFATTADVPRAEAPDPNPLQLGRPAASEPARPLKRVAPDPPPNTASWREYATQLLEQIETSHQYDVEALERPSDVVDHLTEYLRMARELFLTRFKDEPVAADEFDRQMALLLDAKGATTFARHLGVAWYAISQPKPAETPSAVA